MFINTKTKKIVGRKELSNLTNISFGPDAFITDNTLAGTAYRVLRGGNMPALLPWTVIEEGEPSAVNGEWSRTWSLRAMTEQEIVEHKGNLKMALKVVRSQYEMGGFDFNGMFIESDAKTEQRLIGARVKAESDPTYVIEQWKVGSQFVSLDAATIIAISDALSAHIAQSFSFEGAISAKIDAGEYWDAVEVADAYEALVNG